MLGEKRFRQKKNNSKTSHGIAKPLLTYNHYSLICLHKYLQNICNSNMSLQFTSLSFFSFYLFAMNENNSIDTKLQRTQLQCESLRGIAKYQTQQFIELREFALLEKEVLTSCKENQNSINSNSSDGNTVEIVKSTNSIAVNTEEFCGKEISINNKVSDIQLTIIYYLFDNRKPIHYLFVSHLYSQKVK